MTQPTRFDLAARFAMALLQGKSGDELVKRAGVGPETFSQDVNAIATSACRVADAVFERTAQHIEDSEAQIEELAAQNRQLATANAEAEIDIGILIAQLREVVAAASDCQDPLWVGCAEAFARMDAAIKSAREVLPIYKDVAAVDSTTTAAAEADSNRDSEAPSAAVAVGRFSNDPEKPS